MKIVLILLGYLGWHYSKALYSLTNVWKNFFIFISDFFSINLLLKNFFAPWKRMAENYPKIFELKKYIFTFIANTIVRIVGIIMRTFLILLSLICFLLLFFLYPFCLIIWLFLPLIVIFLIILGFILIIFK